MFNIFKSEGGSIIKVIKLKFIGFWKDFDYTKTILYYCLSKHYQIEVCEDADYIICSIFGKAYEYCKYPQVRIMYEGENYIPDFNLIDYGICNYPLDFQDRNFYFPFFIDEFGHFENITKKDRNYSADILNSKSYFANFIAGHESEYNIRGDFFKKLCKYKRVESPGNYLNNMPKGHTVAWQNDTKRDFQSKSKFTLCFESTKHEGFITEKLTDAFYADTIPVYYGSSHVTEIFNPKAFINCSDYESFDAVIEKIKELDNDDEKYLKMLRQPIFNDPDFYEKKMEDFERFLCNIFDQPIEKAYRRSRVYSPKTFDDFLKSAIKPDSLTFKKLITAFFKRLKYFIHVFLKITSNKLKKIFKIKN